MENTDITAADIEFFESMRRLETEAFSEMMKLPGWHYRDLPRMHPDLMKQFRELVGDDNLRWITFADYGSTVRGQVMISPDGMARINEHSKSKVHIT